MLYEENRVEWEEKGVFVFGRRNEGDDGLG